MSDPLNETWRIWLGVDTDGYNGTGSYLDQVAIKVSSSVVAATLVSAPGGTGSWRLLSGGITLNSGYGVDIPPGNGAGIDYGWTFDVTMANGALFSDSDSSIKARFVDMHGAKSGALISEPIRLSLVTDMPEPESYALMLASLGLMGAVVRLRNSRKNQPAPPTDASRLSTLAAA